MSTQIFHHYRQRFSYLKSPYKFLQFLNADTNKAEVKLFPVLIEAPHHEAYWELDLSSIYFASEQCRSDWLKAPILLRTVREVT
jgi:hypothetical protein